MTQKITPVKTWKGFNLAILKVNLNPLWKNQSFTIGLRPLTSYCYPPVEAYWHDHVQALRPRTLSAFKMQYRSYSMLLFMIIIIIITALNKSSNDYIFLNHLKWWYIVVELIFILKTINKLFVFRPLKTQLN